MKKGSARVNPAEYQRAAEHLITEGKKTVDIEQLLDVILNSTKNRYKELNVDNNMKVFMLKHPETLMQAILKGVQMVLN